MQENIFKTFGCRLNTFETEVIKNFVEEKNLRNVVILNTCAVTTEAERKAKREVKKLRSQNPDSFIIVTGCAAQLKPDFFRNMDAVNLVLGNKEKLSESSWKKISKIKTDVEPASDDEFISDIMSYSRLPSKTIRPSKTKTRAFI